MSKIQTIQAREIMDSRGLPTVEVSLWLENGQSVTTSVPSGTSKGKDEALELRDEDPERMFGQGVLKAVENVNKVLGPKIIGMDPTQQLEIDQLMINLDGSKNKNQLGANAILAVSQAVLKAGALASNLPVYSYVQQKYQLTTELAIPNCIYSVVNGGEHGADNLDIQEFQVIVASNYDFPTALGIVATFQKKLEEVLIIKGAIHSVGLLGGFTPNLYNNTDVFEILIETSKTTAYKFAQDIFFGIDASASSFFSHNKYTLKDKPQPYSAAELLEYYKNIRNTYKVIYIEDPFQEDDKQSWQNITNEMGETTKIAGDSFLVTNKEKIDQAIKDKSCNTLVAKPNQIGSISETIDVISIAKQAGWQVAISHRSGETTDDLIADLAVGVGADFSKFGPINRGERTVKYNRLLKIYQDIAPQKQPNQSDSLQNNNAQT
ncbi:MAG: phosphopyruvate hydratase [Candidatus Woesebacteria bacterium]